MYLRLLGRMGALSPSRLLLRFLSDADACVLSSSNDGALETLSPTLIARKHSLRLSLNRFQKGVAHLAGTTLDDEEFHTRQYSLLVGKLDVIVVRSLLHGSITDDTRAFVVVHAKKILKTSTHEVLLVPIINCIDDDLCPKK